jgi:hypothetical protein
MASASFLKPTVLRRGAPTLLIASAALFSSKEVPTERATTILNDYDVSTIVVVAPNIVLAPRDGIVYATIPIDDTSADPPPADFLDRVMAEYQRHVLRTPARAFMIVCQMGINRSAYAAAGVLWQTTLPRPWSSPEEMIEHMRTLQRAQRGAYLLTNPAFEESLRVWCRA